MSQAYAFNFIFVDSFPSKKVLAGFLFTDFLNSKSELIIVSNFFYYRPSLSAFSTTARIFTVFDSLYSIKLIVVKITIRLLKKLYFFKSQHFLLLLLSNSAR